MTTPDARTSRFLGIAGPTSTDQEKASVKQAMFLLRYRARIASLVDVELV